MLEAFEPVLIRTPRETSQAKNRKNLPTTYGGMRQTCMHAEMATLTSAPTAAVGIGSNRINAAPRRGGEIHRYHASFGLRHTCSTNTTAGLYIVWHSPVQHDVASGFPSHHNIAIVAGTETHLQYRIVQCNNSIRHSDCDNRTTTQDVLWR